MNKERRSPRAGVAELLLLDEPGKPRHPYLAFRMLAVRTKNPEKGRYVSRQFRLKQDKYGNPELWLKGRLFIRFLPDRMKVDVSKLDRRIVRWANMFLYYSGMAISRFDRETIQLGHIYYTSSSAVLPPRNSVEFNKKENTLEAIYKEKYVRISDIWFMSNRYMPEGISGVRS